MSDTLTHSRAKILTKDWVRCLFLLLIGFLVHLPALQGEPIWDDNSLVRDNPLIKSPLLVAETFRHYLSLDGASTHYRPVQTISYCLDYLLWHTNTYGFHVTNVLLHVGSGILLYFLLCRILLPLTAPAGEHDPQSRAQKVTIGAFLVALLWVIHPVHSAAVDYISGRADSLAFFFASAAWLLFLRGRASRGGFAFTCFAAAVVLMLLALCSRETGCIWVLLFLAHLFIVDRETSRSGKWITAAACVAVVGLYAGLRQLPPPNAPLIASDASGVSSRVVLMLRALGDYARLMLWPSNLHVERTVELSPSLLNGAMLRDTVARHALTIIGTVAAIVLIFGSFLKGRAHRIRAFGAAWFLMAYLPISNLLPLNATVAEHWLYLPSVGFLVFLLGCCLELPRSARTLAAFAAGVAVLGLGARSFVRSNDWISPEMFYRHAIASGSAKARMALNLGQIYAAAGKFDKAEPLLRKVVEMHPDYAMAQNALGHLLLTEGKAEEADRVFAVATKLAQTTQRGEPKTWIAALNVAYMRVQENDIPAALSVLDQANRDYPKTWPLINLQAELVAKTSGAAAALPPLESFAREHWWHFGAALAVGKLRLENGDFAGASEALWHASWLDVYDVASLNTLALISIQRGDMKRACEIQRRAVAREPDEPRQRVLLSDILDKMGRADDARACIADASRLEALVRDRAAVN